MYYYILIINVLIYMIYYNIMLHNNVQMSSYHVLCLHVCGWNLLYVIYLAFFPLSKYLYLIMYDMIVCIRVG